MNLDLFRTPKHLPFLCYRKTDTAPADMTICAAVAGCMTLEPGLMPIIEQPSFDELWTLVDIKSGINHEHAPMIAANRLFNEIARRTRRSVGNILFVPSDALKAKFEEHNSKYGMVMDVVVDSSLKDNELRATYWKIIHDAVVDGGIQISPEGFSCIRRDGPILGDYRDYFVCGFM